MCIEWSCRWHWHLFLQLVGQFLQKQLRYWNGIDRNSYIYYETEPVGLPVEGQVLTRVFTHDYGWLPFIDLRCILHEYISVDGWNLASVLSFWNLIKIPGCISPFQWCHCSFYIGDSDLGSPVRPAPFYSQVQNLHQGPSYIPAVISSSPTIHLY